MVSVVILVHNAPLYALHTLKTLKMTKNVDYEVIVLDNASNAKTVNLLEKLQTQGYIDKLLLEKENHWFAKGNNLAVEQCASESDRILLLNSDVEIRDPYWLEILLSYMPITGVVSYGVSKAQGVDRADGYCYLIDRKTYEQYKLDEEFFFWFAITKMQAQLLQAGVAVRAIEHHNHLLYHYGGKSGAVSMSEKGMATDEQLVQEWYADHKVEIISTVAGRQMNYKRYGFVNMYAKFDGFASRVKRKLRRVFSKTE